MTIRVREPFELHTLPELFRKSALLYPHKTALRKRRKDGWDEYSYGELAILVKKIAKFLTEKRVEKGDRIGILGEGSPEWIIASVAIQWIGAIPVPLDVRSKTSEQEQIIEGAIKYKKCYNKNDDALSGG